MQSSTCKVKLKKIKKKNLFSLICDGYISHDKVSLKFMSDTKIRIIRSTGSNFDFDIFICIWASAIKTTSALKPKNISIIFRLWDIRLLKCSFQHPFFVFHEFYFQIVQPFDSVTLQSFHSKSRLSCQNSHICHLSPGKYRISKNYLEYCTWHTCEEWNIDIEYLDNNRVSQKIAYWIVAQIKCCGAKFSLIFTFDPAKSM